MRRVGRVHLENLLTQHCGDGGIGGDGGPQVGKGFGKVLQHLGLGTGIRGTTFIVESVSGHELNDKSRKCAEGLPATPLGSTAAPGMFRGA